jgi:hypothetical protein
MLSQDELNFLSRFFDTWNQFVKFERNRREWEELAEEEEAEEHYARENGLDSVYYCWNCKYSECERHQGKIWEFETLSDTDQDD